MPQLVADPVAHAPSFRAHRAGVLNAPPAFLSPLSADVQDSRLPPDLGCLYQSVHTLRQRLT